MTESLFHTLKSHLIHDSVFATRKEANAVLFDYIEIYYNRIRRHSANGWLSPEAFEQKYFKNLEGSAAQQHCLRSRQEFFLIKCGVSLCAAIDEKKNVSLVEPKNVVLLGSNFKDK